MDATFLLWYTGANRETQMHTKTATKSKLLMKTGFKGYDICINPYVGCQMGCKFCYVRFFVKDDAHEWGDFVRIREHVKTKLPKELAVVSEDARLVLGTMTDPYMPLEKVHRITRSALESILKSGKFSKVGIFTRSPVILDDIDLIKKLPRVRVHVSISPFQDDMLRKLEPIAIPRKTRLDMIKKLKDAGIRVHCNVAPAMPYYSEIGIPELAKELGKLKIDEFFVDPIQAYKNAYDSVSSTLEDDPNWEGVSETLLDKQRYIGWKIDFKAQWRAAWAKHGSKNTLAIWSDHENKVWRNLLTDESMDHKLYGDDLDAERQESKVQVG